MDNQPSGLFGGTNILGALSQTQPQTTPQDSSYTPPQASEPSRGNFFTRALPTIGGVLGGLVSLPAEALDLVSGVGGTALNVAGAAGGAGLGKAIENKLEGQSAGSGVLGSAAGGAIGQGIGGIAGKIGGKLLGFAGEKATEVAPNLFKGQFARGAIGSDAAQKLLNYGISDSKQLPQIAEMVTGTGGALNRGVEKSLMQIGQKTDVADLIGSKLSPTGMAENLIANESTIGDTAGRKVLGVVNKAVQNMLGGTEGMVGKQLADPLDVLNQSRVFSKLAAKARDVAYRTGNAEQQGVANVYQGLADELNSRIFNPAGQQMLIPDTVKSEIIANLSPLKSVNPTVYNNLVQHVSGAQSLEDLRALQSPFVQGSQAVRETMQAIDRGPGVSGSQMAGKLPVPIVGGGGTGKGTMLGILGSAARKAADTPAAVKALQGGGDILSTIGGSRAPGLIGGATGVTAGTLNNMIQPGTIAPGGAMLPQQSTQLPTQQSGAGLNPQDASRVLAEMAFFAPGALSSLVPTEQQQQNVAQALAAENALRGLSAPPSGGLLSNVAARLGVGGTGEYQRQAESAAEQVAQALPGTDKEAIQKQLTDYLAGGQNISEAISSLMERLNAVAQANRQTGLQGLLGFNSAPQQPQGVLGALSGVQ